MLNLELTSKLGAVDYDKQPQIMAWRLRTVKLTWALISIMESVHTEETQHNALSIDNIMLNWDAKFNVKSGVLIGEPLREHEKMLCKFAQLIKTA